jgi:hypothetical protein
MSAEVFTQFAEAVDPDKAFAAAVEAAQFDYGHGGYTGSIAEKDSFVVIESTPMAYGDAEDLADNLIRVDDERIDDKWGPAGAIAVSDPQGWLFFGWASS